MLWSVPTIPGHRLNMRSCGRAPARRLDRGFLGCSQAPASTGSCSIEWSHWIDATPNDDLTPQVRRDRRIDAPGYPAIGLDTPVLIAWKIPCPATSSRPARSFRRRSLPASAPTFPAR
jgi:hypothetical protein